MGYQNARKVSVVSAATDPDAPWINVVNVASFAVRDELTMRVLEAHRHEWSDRFRRKLMEYKLRR